jgi:hypothetical protein
VLSGAGDTASVVTKPDGNSQAETEGGEKAASKGQLELNRWYAEWWLKGKPPHFLPPGYEEDPDDRFIDGLPVKDIGIGKTKDWSVKWKPRTPPTHQDEDDKS